jgi:hypothetical protein
MNVRFQVLTVVIMMMAIFWLAALCSLVEAYQHNRGACQLMMEAARNVGIFLLGYAVQQPRRHIFSKWMFNDINN